MGLADRVAADDERNRLLVIHRHTTEGLPNVPSGREDPRRQPRSQREGTTTIASERSSFESRQLRPNSVRSMSALAAARSSHTRSASEPAQSLAGPRSRSRGTSSLRRHLKVGQQRGTGAGARNWGGCEELGRNEKLGRRRVDAPLSSSLRGWLSTARHRAPHSRWPSPPRSAATAQHPRTEERRAQEAHRGPLSASPI
jgi:hypothetical protein